MNDILSGLNPEQLAAVQHDLGPQLVIAGAGTGKTQVITRRIAYLIAEGKAKPSEILALTFTEKAAREMSDRLYELIGWESFQVPVLTFHAFGAELLGRFASHIGRSVRGGLLSDVQKTLLLQQHFGRIRLQYYGPQPDSYEFLEGVVAYIGQVQNAGVTAEQYSEFVAGLQANPGEMHPRDIQEQADLARIYTLYEELKREVGAYDYNDQLVLPLEILRTRPNLAERLAREYRYVLVDEYQDTNAVQDALLRTFVGRAGNIFAVGDDDQAIYGFRGAEINNILAFAEHYDLSAPVVLVRNYRSGQKILDGAYRLIQHNNPARLEEKLGINKRLLALHDESVASFMAYANTAREQEGVLEAIESRIGRGEAPASIAVLAATHAPLRAMAKGMERLGIPYALSTSVSIFDQPELIALWYLLKWLQWQASEEAIAHVVLGPFIGWSAEEYREVWDVCQNELVSFEEALHKGESARWLELAHNLELWRGWAREVPVSQLAFRLVFDTVLAQAWQLKAETSPRMGRVFEDLQRLFEQMQEFEAVALSPYLQAYLEAFPKPPVLEVSEPMGDDSGVQLLTVHAAKGLEFEVVYVVGVSHRSWSPGRSLGRVLPLGLVKARDLPVDHEFRRLMYVAATRARQELIVSAPVATAAGTKQLVSPFVGEMFGVEVLEANLPAIKSRETEDPLNKIQRFYPFQAESQSKELPFETNDGWLELGVTALGSYEFCPFEFYMQYVLGIAQPVGPNLSFGSALHHVFERYYKSRMADRGVDFAELHLALDETWSNRGYSDRDEAETDKQLAHETLDRFLAREQQTQRVIVASEMPIRFEIAEAKLRLRGKIDVLFERSDGAEIRDFKTGRTKTDPEKLAKQAKDNFQLRTYALAYEQLRGVLPAAVVLDYVVTGIEGEAHLSPLIVRNHRAKLVEMARKIRERDFAPNSSALHVCAAVRYYGTGEAEE